MAYPDDSNMTSLTRLKEWVPIDASQTAADAALTALIERASEAIRLWTRRPKFFSHSVTERRHGNGQQRIFPRVQPCTGVTSVTVNGVAIPESTSWDISGWYIDDGAIVLVGYCFTLGQSNVELVYTAGFSTTGQEQGAAEQACLELCNRKWQNRDHTGMTAQGLGNQVWSKFNEQDIPAEVRALLQPLVRVTALS